MSVTQPEISEVIDIRSSGAIASGGPSRLLAKTAMLEVRRLMLSKGREIPTHQAPGEITVHCLEGRIAFTAGGQDARARGRPDDRPGGRRAAFGRRPGRLDRARHKGPPRQPIRPLRWVARRESGAQAMRKLTVRIKRYDPERDDSPRREIYHVEADPMDRVLDVLLRIKEEQDGRLEIMNDVTGPGGAGRSSTARAPAPAGSR